MSRFATVIGIWVLAAAAGILGYQGLTYYFYDYWQPVTVAFIWEKVVGPWWAGGPGWIGGLAAWCGGLPLFAVGVALAYLCFLISDTVARHELPDR